MMTASHPKGQNWLNPVAEGATVVDWKGEPVAGTRVVLLPAAGDRFKVVESEGRSNFEWFPTRPRGNTSPRFISKSEWYMTKALANDGEWVHEYYESRGDGTLEWNADPVKTFCQGVKMPESELKVCNWTAEGYTIFPGATDTKAAVCLAVFLNGTIGTNDECLASFSEGLVAPGAVELLAGGDNDCSLDSSGDGGSARAIACLFSVSSRKTLSGFYDSNMYSDKDVYLAADGGHRLYYAAVAADGALSELCKSPTFEIDMASPLVTLFAMEKDHQMEDFEDVVLDDEAAEGYAAEAVAALKTGVITPSGIVTAMFTEYMKRIVRSVWIEGAALDTGNMEADPVKLTLDGFGYHNKKTFAFAGITSDRDIAQHLFWPAIVPYSGPAWIEYDAFELNKLPVPSGDADSEEEQIGVFELDVQTTCMRGEPDEPNCDSNDARDCRKYCGATSPCNKCLAVTRAGREFATPEIAEACAAACDDCRECEPLAACDGPEASRTLNCSTTGKGSYSCGNCAASTAHKYLVHPDIVQRIDAAASAAKGMSAADVQAAKINGEWPIDIDGMVDCASDSAKEMMSSTTLPGFLEALDIPFFSQIPSRYLHGEHGLYSVLCLKWAMKVGKLSVAYYPFEIGIRDVDVWVAEGAPGAYAFSLADYETGAQSSLIEIWVNPWNAVKHLAVVDEPCSGELNPFLMSSGDPVQQLAACNTSSPDVMVPFRSQPSVRVLNEILEPVSGYQVKAAFIPQDWLLPGSDANIFANATTDTEYGLLFYTKILSIGGNLRAKQLEALSGISPSEIETLFKSQISLPSDHEGVARFTSLQFTDAVRGNDNKYFVVFYTADDPRNGMQVVNHTNFAFSKTVVSVDKRMQMEFVQGVPKAVDLGVATAAPPTLRFYSDVKNCLICGPEGLPECSMNDDGSAEYTYYAKRAAASNGSFTHPFVGSVSLIANTLKSAGIYSPATLADKLRVSSNIFRGNTLFNAGTFKAENCKSAEGPYHGTLEIPNFQWAAGYTGDRAEIVPVGSLALHSPGSCEVQEQVHADFTGAGATETEISNVLASLTLGLQPPRTVEVDKLAGIVQVTARSALGNVLKNIRVTMEVEELAVPLMEKAKRFFDGISTGVVEKQPAKPVIDPDFVTALTDTNGVASFSVKLLAGVNGDYAFRFTAQGKSSPPTRTFALVNPITATKLTSMRVVPNAEMRDFPDGWNGLVDWSEEVLSFTPEEATLHVTLKVDINTTTDAGVPYRFEGVAIDSEEKSTTNMTFVLKQLKNSLLDDVGAVNISEQLFCGLVTAILPCAKQFGFSYDRVLGSTDQSSLGDAAVVYLTEFNEEASDFVNKHPHEHAIHTKMMQNEATGVATCALDTPDGNGWLPEPEKRSHVALDTWMRYQMAHCDEIKKNAEDGMNARCKLPTTRCAGKNGVRDGVCIESGNAASCDGGEMIASRDCPGGHVRDAKCCTSGKVVDFNEQIRMAVLRETIEFVDNLTMADVAAEIVEVVVGQADGDATTCNPAATLQALKGAGKANFREIALIMLELGTDADQITSFGDIFKLVSAGGQNVNSKPTASKGAVLGDIAPTEKDDTGHITLSIPMRVHKAGAYRIQLYVNGIAIEESNVITVAKFVPSKSGTRTVRALVFFFGLILCLGNSRANSKVVFYVAALLIPVALAVLYIEEVKLEADIMNSKFKEVTMSTILAVLVACFFYEILKSIFGWGLEFSEERRQAYVMYVHRMFHGQAASPVYEKRVNKMHDDGSSNFVNNMMRVQLRQSGGNESSDKWQHTLWTRLWHEERQIKLWPIEIAQDKLKAAQEAHKKWLKSQPEAKKDANQPNSVTSQAVAEAEDNVNSAKACEVARVHPYYWQSGTVEQLVSHATDHSRFNNSEAFFFPQRLWSAALIGTFSVIYIAYKFWNNIATLATGFEAVNQAKPIRVGFNMLVQMEEKYYDSFGGVDLARGDIEDVFVQAARLNRVMQNLGASLKIAGGIGLGVSLFLVGFMWLQLFATFRRDSLNLRRTGKCKNVVLTPWLYASGRVPKSMFGARYVFEFLGIAVANTVISFQLIGYTLTLVFAILIWDTSRMAIWLLVKSLYVKLLIIVGSVVAKEVGVMVANAYASSADGRYITDPGVFGFLDFILIFIGTMSGYMAAVLRIVMSLLAMLIGFASMTTPSTPIWLYNSSAIAVLGALRDKVVAAYSCMLFIHNMQNNPISHVFMWQLLETVRGTPEAKPMSNKSPLTKKKRLIRNRFQLYVMLHKYPVLRAYRAVRHGSQALVAGTSAATSGVRDSRVHIQGVTEETSFTDIQTAGDNRDGSGGGGNSADSRVSQPQVAYGAVQRHPLYDVHTDGVVGPAAKGQQSNTSNTPVLHANGTPSSPPAPVPAVGNDVNAENAQLRAQVARLEAVLAHNSVRHVIDAVSV